MDVSRLVFQIKVSLYEEENVVYFSILEGLPLKIDLFLKELCPSA